MEVLSTPLGMGRTTLRPLTAATWPLALPHETQGARALVIRPLPNNAAMWPGGSGYSTVTDVSRFVIALMDGGRLDGAPALEPPVVEKLLAPQVRLPGDGGVSYGYGTMQFDTRGARVVTHGGVSRGYGSTIQMVPEKKFAIVVLTNRNGETLPATRNRAMEIAIPDAPAETEPAKVTLHQRNCGGTRGCTSTSPSDGTWSSRMAELFLKIGDSSRRPTPLGNHTFLGGRTVPWRSSRMLQAT